MFGSFSYLDRHVARHKDCPLKDHFEEKELLWIVKVINDEQWKEVLRMKNYLPTTTVTLPRLGSFYTSMSPLKKYIRFSLITLRRLREKLEVKRGKEGFDPNNSFLQAVHDDLELKTRMAWKQLDEMRKIIILRTIKSNYRKRMRGQEDTIKYTYENIDFKFVHEFLEKRNRRKKLDKKK